MISNSSPWSNRGCQRPECLICINQPGCCLKSNITYSITCIHCALAGNKSVYIGESHRTLFDRQQEHIQALATSNTNYAVVRHHQEQHEGLEPNYSFRFMKQHKTSLERQISEGLLIESTEADFILNSKGEWGCNSIPRGNYSSETGNTGFSCFLM